MHYNGVIDRKKVKKKAKQTSTPRFSFTQYTLRLCRCIQNLTTLALIGAEKLLRTILLERKKKWTNKGNDKHEDADSVLHITTNHTQCLGKISKS